MARRPRIDSSSEMVKVVQAAGKEISPPSNVPLTSEQFPFFASIIDEFARSEWTAHSLELAAMLARDMEARERNQRLLLEEGDTIMTPKGHPAINPRRTVVQTLAGTIFNTRRSLSLHAAAKGGTTKDIGNRRKIAKGIEAQANDDLLARPS